jgi:hypothetical protein
MRAWEFGAGALIAALEPGLRRTSSSRLLGWGAAIVLAAGFAASAVAPVFPGWVATLVVLGTAGLIVQGTGTTGRGGAEGPEVREGRVGEVQVRSTFVLLETSPLTWAGDLSYSWYLWHWPLIVVAKAVWPDNRPAVLLAGVASLLAAWAMYRVVETPFRVRSQDSERTQTGKLVGSLALAGAAASVTLLFLAVEGSPGSLGSRWQVLVRHHDDVVLGCDGDLDLPFDPAACTWTPEGSAARGSVVLTGDSNAGHLTEAVVGAALARSHQAVVRTHSGCPFSLTDPGECGDHSRGVVQSLESLPPSIVVVGQSFEHFRVGMGESSEEGAAARLEGLTGFLRAIRGGGHDVVLLAQVPNPPHWAPAFCPAFRFGRGIDEFCGGAFGIDESAAAEAETEAVLDYLAGEVPGIRVLDLSGPLCPGGRCPYTLDDRLVHRDPGHVSVDTALRLIPAVAAGLFAPDPPASVP